MAVRLAITLLRMRWKARIMYPTSFILGIIGQWFGYSAEFLCMWLLISRFDSLHGWTPYQMMVLYSFNICCYAGASSLAYGVSRNLPDVIRRGGLDDVLIKPIDSLWYMLFSTLSVNYIAHFSLGLFGIAIGLYNSVGYVSVSVILFTILMICCGVVINISIMILLALPAIRMGGKMSLASFYLQIRELMYYPLPIFGDGLQFVFTFIIPCAYTSYYPAMVLFGKADDVYSGSIIPYIGPLIAVIMIALVHILWHRAIQIYQSSGN